MRSLFVCFFVVFFGFTGSAQIRTNLPYSIFGIGEINPKGFGRNLAMGRTGIALSSDHYLNNLNPASYHSMDSISFFFDFGLALDLVKYETTYNIQHGRDANFRNLAMGFKVSKNWTSSIGIVPFSTVGYRVQTTKNVEGTTDLFTADLTGSGGLSQFYYDNSFLLFRHLSLGVSASYLFGNIESDENVQYSNIPNNILTKQTSRLDKIILDFGFQYYFPVMKDFQVTVGGVFGNTHKLNFKEEILISQSNGLVFEDKITQTGTFDFPMYYGGGLSVNWAKKLTVSADYMFRNWSSASSSNSQYQYVNTNSFRVGAELIPGRMNQYGFMGRIAYRAGYYYEDSYIQINNKAVVENGFSLGFGIPFLKNKTSINLSYNSGVRGSLKYGLIRENYNSFMLSLTLHDWWFMKAKYD
jgi:hypothetical protein